jgi:hypothetical protein
MLSGEATNTDFIVFGLTQPGKKKIGRLNRKIIKLKGGQ